MPEVHRAQLLLEREQFQVLRQIAQEDGVSVSELVRRLVDEEIRRRGQQKHQSGGQQPTGRRLEALKRIGQRRFEIYAQRRAQAITLPSQAPPPPAEETDHAPPAPSHP